MEKLVLASVKTMEFVIMELVNADKDSQENIANIKM